mmetsp:Transcript_22380/g.27811  ORF Transcript_22380/g.27811 Transcript_22380/m.27811 type:complete len:599 (+) Transcript_22380:396-2192(+)
MCIPSSRSTKDPPSIEEKRARERIRGPPRHKTAAEQELVHRALSHQPQLRRFDSADYFTAMAADKEKKSFIQDEEKNHQIDDFLDRDTYTRVLDEDDINEYTNAEAILYDLNATHNKDFHKSTSIAWAIVMLALVLRWGVSLHPYSGEASPPRFGDYEAHRHWMEITLNLPLQQWYQYDLQYWGLDYPPLMAYIEYALGFVSRLVEPNSVAFEISRGYETPSHRSFMRGTVLIFDALFIIFPLYLLLWRHPERLALVLSSPALVLVDHAHFQYNSLPIGCTIWCLWAMKNKYPALAAIFFSLACNCKQTALYYAPAVFIFMLLESKIWTLTKIAISTITTFFICWWPIIRAGAALDALARLFPIDRGVFEDKVGNFWYVAQVFLRARDKLSQTNLVKIATGLTAVFAFIPCCIAAFRSSFFINISQKSTIFALSLHVSALAFFLFSYHVHEKAILVPLVPLFLVPETPPLYTSIFSLTAGISLLPLLIFEQSTMAYLPILIVHILTLDYNWQLHNAHWKFRCALVPFIICHFLPLFIMPPTRFPHLYSALLALISAAIFGISYLASAFRLINITSSCCSFAVGDASSSVPTHNNKKFQ